MKLTIKRGTTSKRIMIFIGDARSGSEDGLTGLAYNSAGLVCSYSREDHGNVGAVSVTLAAGTRGTFVDSGAAGTGGGFIEKDSTKQPGFYELSLPDAALATGAQWCVIELHGATNMIPVKIELQLAATDDQDVAGIASAITTLNTNAATILNSVNAITTNTARGKLILPAWMEIPDSGTATYEFDLNIYSLQGQLEAPDAAPSIHARKADGTSLDSLLASITMTLVSTGRYKVSFSFLSNQAKLQVLVDASWAVGAVPFAITDTSAIVDAETITTLLAIKAKTDLLPAQPAAAGDQMDLIAALNSDAVSAIQNGLMLATNKDGFKLASDGLSLVLIDGVALPAALEYIAAATSGKLSGAGTTTEIFVGLDGVTARLTATVDPAGNRTAIDYH